MRVTKWNLRKPQHACILLLSMSGTCSHLFHGLHRRGRERPGPLNRDERETAQPGVCAHGGQQRAATKVLSEVVEGVVDGEVLEARVVAQRVKHALKLGAREDGGDKQQPRERRRVGGDEAAHGGRDGRNVTFVFFEPHSD